MLKMMRFLNFTTSKTIVIVLLVFNASWSEANPTPISQTPSTSGVGPNHISSSFTATKQKDGLVKRNVKVPDSTVSGSATAKSYDPAPEFYRGSSSASKASSVTTADSATASFVSKPVTFPDSTGHTKYNSNDLSQKLANTYDNWKQLHTQGSAQDRISLKPFGSGESNGLTAGYAHGGHSHYIDYGGAGGHGGYYGGQSAEVAGGIPFDVYGGKGSGQYAGAGGEYSYTYPEGAHEPAVHKDYHNISKKTLLAKSFLIPLASAAVLGIAAALVSHPWLLQLGAVSGAPLGATFLGKRRRRDLSASSALRAGLATTSEQQSSTDGAIDGTDIAYRAYNPSGEVYV